MEKEKTTHLGKMFIGMFVSSLFLSVVVFNIFNFEYTLIFILCFSLAVIATGFTGLENIIIIHKNMLELSL